MAAPKPNHNLPQGNTNDHSDDGALMAFWEEWEEALAQGRPFPFLSPQDIAPLPLEEIPYLSDADFEQFQAAIVLTDDGSVSDDNYKHADKVFIDDFIAPKICTCSDREGMIPLPPTAFALFRNVLALQNGSLEVNTFTARARELWASGAEEFYNELEEKAADAYSQRYPKALAKAGKTYCKANDFGDSLNCTCGAWEQNKDFHTRLLEAKDEADAEASDYFAQQEEARSGNQAIVIPDDEESSADGEADQPNYDSEQDADHESDVEEGPEAEVADFQQVGGAAEENDEDDLVFIESRPRQSKTPERRFSSESSGLSDAPSSPVAPTPPQEAPEEPSEDEDEEDEEPLFAVRDIIQETKNKYRVSWEDNHVTGEKYPPTWEPKANVNVAAVFDWEAKKKAKQAAKEKATSQASAGAQENESRASASGSGKRRRNSSAGSGDSPNKRPDTYKFKGTVYAVQGDEPEEWLNGK